MPSQSTVAAVALLLLQTANAANAAGQRARDTTIKLAGAPRSPGGGTVTKLLTIGDANGADEYLFSAMSGVLITKDGTIWILDVPEAMSNPASLRVFDANGKYLRTVGGKGSGPGEYQEPTGLAQLPDGRVALRDITAGRVNVYTPAGKPDTTWTFTTRYQWPIRGRDGLSVDANGLVWMPFSIINPADRLDRKTGFVRLSARGQIIDTVIGPVLPKPPRASITLTSSDGRSTTTLGPPYQPVATWFWNPGGYFATATTSRYAIDLRVPPAAAARGRAPAPWKDGDPVVSIRRTVPPVPVNEDERQNRKAILEADVTGRTGTRSGPIPEIPRVKMPITGVQFGTDGRAWVSVSMPSEHFQAEPVVPRAGYVTLPALNFREPTALDVFEPTGVYVGRVVLPAGAFPTVIRGDDLWCVSRDNDGVNYLTKYRVTWK